jgi:hypothetical protein
MTPNGRLLRRQQPVQNKYQFGSYDVRGSCPFRVIVIDRESKVKYSDDGVMEPALIAGQAATIENEAAVAALPTEEAGS